MVKKSEAKIISEDEAHAEYDEMLDEMGINALQYIGGARALEEIDEIRYSLGFDEEIDNMRDNDIYVRGINDDDFPEDNPDAEIISEDEAKRRYNESLDENKDYILKDYAASDILRRVDETAYDEGYNDYTNNLAEDDIFVENETEPYEYEPEDDVDDYNVDEKGTPIKPQQYVASYGKAVTKRKRKMPKGGKQASWG